MRLATAAAPCHSGAPRRRGAAAAPWRPAARLLAAAALAGALSAQADEPRPDGRPDTPRAYAALAPLDLVSGEGLQRVELPPSVLRMVRAPGLADLRIFNGEGRSVPVALARAPAPPERPLRLVGLPRFAWPERAGTAAPAGGVKVEVNAEGAVVRVDAGRTAPATADTPPAMWLLDASGIAKAGERLAALRLDWPTRPEGVAGQVVVEASEDFTRWQTIARGPLLETAGADASAPMLKRIELPAHTHTPRYLRVRTTPALALSEVSAELRGDTPPPPLDGMRVSFRPTPAADAGAPREWTADTEGVLPLLPIARIELHLPQPNTVGSLLLAQRDDPKSTWRPVATVPAYRLLREGQEVHAPPLDLKTAPARHWRLSLAPQAPDMGAEPIDATLSWQPPQLVFAAQGSGPFQLAVGRAGAPAVTVPLTTLIPGHQPGDELRLPAATLGVLTPQAVPRPTLAERLRDAGPAEHRKWALWAVLFGAVLGLGWLAWRLVGEMKKDGGAGA